MPLRQARSFVREISPASSPDMGLWQPIARHLRLRRHLGRETRLLFSINAEFNPLAMSRPDRWAKSAAVFSSLADAILVSGPLTGTRSIARTSKPSAKPSRTFLVPRQHRRHHRQCATSSPSQTA
jgi:predicted TIM-barrel enzyme